MRDSASDLNFAVLLWWIPMPFLVFLIVLVDDRIATRSLS